MRNSLSLAALLVCFFPVAHAGNVTLTWTAPTTCADGSPTTDCPTTGYEISEGLSTTSTYTVKETVAATVTSRTYSYSPGVRCFSAKTISNGLKSDESTRVCATVPSLPPKAPQGLTVTIAVTVSVP